MLKFVLDHRTTNAHFREGRHSSPESSRGAWTRKQKQTNGNRLVSRCKAAWPLSVCVHPSDFHSNPAECPTDTSLLFCLHLFWCSIPIISGPAGRPRVTISWMFSKQLSRRLSR